MKSDALKVAVVTGNHPYDVQGFHRFFRELEGVDAYIQHIDNFAAIPDSIGLTKGIDFDPEKRRREYDVIMFYSYILPTPVNEGEGYKWWHGAPKTALEQLGDTEQGLFIWHHSLVQWREWPLWHEVVGIDQRKFSSHMDENVHVEIADPEHPITRGLKPFDILDETYKLPDPDPAKGNHALLTTNNANSLRTLGWTRQYKKSRVFCFELGHDKFAWENPAFKTIVQRGLQWSAGRI